MIASVLVVALGAFVALVGSVYVASYGDRGPYDAPLPVGPDAYVGAFVGAEAVLTLAGAIALGVAWGVKRE